MSLFNRLVGTDNEPKIAIHQFTAMLYEYFNGYITGAEFVAAFELVGGEVAEAQWIRDAIIAAPDKVRFLRVLKDCLYLAEGRVAYGDSAAFVQRLRQEVLSQGGSI